MTLYALDASFKFTSGPGDPALEDWLDLVSDHLATLEAKDVSIVSENSGDFTVSLMVDAEANEEIHDVVKDGMDTLRTAFHACDGGTPDWPTLHEAMGGVRVTLIESSQRVLINA